MIFLRVRVFSTAILSLLACISYGGTNSTSNTVTDASEPEEWPYRLPFLGAEAYEQGYDIPLPYGVGLSHMYAQRDIDVTSINVGIGAGNPVPVNDIVRADVTTKVNTTVARLDTWLFPFMNVYGFVGHVDNHSDVTLSLVDGTNNNVNVDTTWELSGPTYGGGAVLAAGYLNYFMTVDVNIFKAELEGDLSEEFTGATYTARAGWNGKALNDRNCRLWLGASYWNTASTIRGSTPILGGFSSINIEVEQEPKNPSNFNFGGYIEITRKIHLVADIGSNFDDAFSALVEINYRLF